nr:MAG TPA: hypothetical protein [Caudoviricetes sp.]
MEHRRLSLLTIMGQQPNAHDIPRHLAKVKLKKGLC